MTLCRLAGMGRGHARRVLSLSQQWSNRNLCSFPVKTLVGIRKSPLAPSLVVFRHFSSHYIEDHAASQEPPINAEVQRQVIDSCASLHSSIMPVNERLGGPLAQHSDKGTSLPFVFLVGNHSSGKSSFINYVMGRNVQTAGVAPTDDCFTVIAPGPNDTDQDGPALIGDPDMGFENLRQFGPTLIHHTQLKVRSDVRNESFMMVDSPGMIDSPTNAMTDQFKNMDRGYDFAGVVRWFAERADIVLLFFDPDKPGTTGETLSVLLHSLAGMDHKLLIVLNKADQFKKIHDFARAYGSLCWNLSKVIPRKDLPRIYTMCLPVAESMEKDQDRSGLSDLHNTRQDVLAQVMKAPNRRIDNSITHLNDSVSLLKMHLEVLEDVQRSFAKRKWESRIQLAATLTGGSSLTALGVYTSLPPTFTAGMVAATILGVGGMQWFHSTKLREVETQLLSPEELSAAFQRTHARQVSDANEFTASLWQRVRDPLRATLQRVGLDNMPAPTRREVDQLDKILTEEIPNLRRLASPTHFGKQQ